MPIQFSDKSVPYGVLVNDIADAVAERIRKRDEPEYISQNEAFRRFGRANVKRWKTTGKIEPCKRTQKLEYKLSELQRLKDAKQDYFK